MRNLAIFFLAATFLCCAQQRMSRLDQAIDRVYEENPHLHQDNNVWSELFSVDALYHLVDCGLIAYSGYELYTIYMTPQKKDSSWVGYYMPSWLYSYHKSATAGILILEMIVLRVLAFRLLDGVHRYCYRPCAALCRW